MKRTCILLIGVLALSALGGTAQAQRGTSAPLGTLPEPAADANGTEARTSRGTAAQQAVERGDIATVAQEKVEPSVNGVSLRGDGTLVGHVTALDGERGTAAPVRDLTIHFVQNAKVKATAKPDHSGRFVAEGVRPGVYSVIASGRAGYSAFSVSINPFNEAQARNKTGGKVIQTAAISQQEGTDVLRIDSIVPLNDLAAVPFPGSDTQDPGAPPPDAPFGADVGGGGGFGPDEGGFGGGGGGDAGLGGLLPLAALLGAAELLGDDGGDGGGGGGGRERAEPESPVLLP